MTKSLVLQSPLQLANAPRIFNSFLAIFVNSIYEQESLKRVDNLLHNLGIFNNIKHELFAIVTFTHILKSDI